MTKVNKLSDVDVQAISLVTQGANGQTFFLRKEHAPAAELVSLPAPSRLVKDDSGDDWSAVYCVVAEPGYQENPGQVGDPDTVDVWAGDDEIRKAAHKFMRNGGLVNKMHETLDPYGSIVENAVAHSDFDVNGTTIKKGSWYVAIEPTEDGRDKIDKGEFGGISIQGTGLRTAAAEVLADAGIPIEKHGGRLMQMVKRVARAAGMSDDEVAELVKAAPTFNGLLAERQFNAQYWDAFYSLREVIAYAFHPGDDAPDDFDPAAHITLALDQFRAWSLTLLAAMPLEKREAIAKEAATLPPDPAAKAQSEEDSAVSTTDEKIDALSAGIAKQTEALEKLTGTLTTSLEKAEAAKAPTADELSKSVDELSKGLKTVQEGIEKLGEGGPTTPADPPAGGDAADKDHPLRGLLG